jgi:hypothetical protein
MEDTTLLHREDDEYDWFFTFGIGDEKNAGCYVKIHGTLMGTREIMTRHFGTKWGFQYPSAEEAGVAKYGLKEIPLPPIRKRPKTLTFEVVESTRGDGSLSLRYEGSAYALKHALQEAGYEPGDTAEFKFID